MTKVSQLANNQFIVNSEEFSMFQSYDSIIVKIELKDYKIFLDSKYWNYSKTTSKYRNMFLNETTKEIKEKIEKGIYTLTNLN